MLKNEIAAVATIINSLGPTRLSGSVRSTWDSTPASVHNTYQIETTEGQFAKTSGLVSYDLTANVVVARQWSQDTDFAASQALLFDLLEEMDAALVPGAASGAYRTISEYSLDTAEYDEGILLLTVGISFTATS